MSNRKKLPPGRQDQIEAAAADARRQVRPPDNPRTGSAQIPDAEQHPIFRQMKKLLFSQLDKEIAAAEAEEPKPFPGDNWCKHFRARNYQPTHWFAATPDRWFCERCAQPILKTYLAGATQCDLCHGNLKELTRIPTLGNTHFGTFVAHAVLCGQWSCMDTWTAQDSNR